MFNNLTVQPLALTEEELQDIEAFARKNELVSIAKLCAELRAIRHMYLTQCARIGRMRNGQPDPDLLRLNEAKAASVRPPKVVSDDPNDFSEA